MEKGNTLIRKPMQVAAKAVQCQYTMLPSEAEMVDELRVRYQREALARHSKPADIAKSEIIRAGIHSLSNMSDTKLYNAIETVEVLKEGRPKKNQANG